MRAKLIADSNKRKRRPVGKEFPLLVAYFKQFEQEQRDGKRGGAQIPMSDIIQVAALNAFRRSELAKELRWSRIDNEHSLVVIFRKDSNGELQNDGHRRREAQTPLLRATRAVIDRQPRIAGEDRVFPFTADTISQRFTNAVKALRKLYPGLFIDLRFHDLRHEAISKAAEVLSEMELKELSGHQTTRHLVRYVHHQREGMKRIADKADGIELKLAA